MRSRCVSTILMFVVAAALLGAAEVRCHAKDATTLRGGATTPQPGGEVQDQGADRPSEAPKAADKPSEVNKPVAADPAPTASEPADAPVAAPAAPPAQATAVTRPTSWRLELALVVLALTAACAVALNLYQFRARRAETGGGEAWPSRADSAPWVADFDAVLRDVQAALAQGAEDQRSTHRDVLETAKRTQARIADLLETTRALTHALDERDREIRRLRQGHDVEVFRRFLSRFVKARRVIDDFDLPPESESEAWGQLRRLLDDAFEECGVVRFEPVVGEDYRQAQGVADNPRTLKALQAEDAFRIARVLEAGYRLRSNGVNETIVKAKVAIYVP